jgi:hypothetical protein
MSVFDFGKIVKNILAAFFIRMEPCLKEIGKEKDLQNKEKDHQLDNYNDPELLANSHFPKPIVIEPNDPVHFFISGPAA